MDGELRALSDLSLAGCQDEREDESLHPLASFAPLRAEKVSLGDVDAFRERVTQYQDPILVRRPCQGVLGTTSRKARHATSVTMTSSMVLRSRLIRIIRRRWTLECRYERVEESRPGRAR